MESYLKNVVGDKPLCCVRSAKNPMHLRVFVTSDNNEVCEVTQAIAELCKSRTTCDGSYIVFNGSGYSPAQSLAEHYAVAMGENDHKYIDLH